MATSRPKLIQKSRPVSPYPQFRGADAHVRIFEWHHGRKVKPGFIVHHRDENKRNNLVCSASPPCPKSYCGNLEELSRREHILQHRPGKMGGAGFPHKTPRKVYHCELCGREKSRSGKICQPCYFAQRKGRTL